MLREQGLPLPDALFVRVFEFDPPVCLQLGDCYLDLENIPRYPFVKATYTSFGGKTIEEVCKVWAALSVCQTPDTVLEEVHH